MHSNPLLGVLLHSVGAFSSSSCYTPQKFTQRWSWEIYWIVQATFAWAIFPVCFALLTIPDYFGLLASCPKDVMLRSFLFGLLYGIGGMSFGLGIRYIGFSLNYALAIGISAVLGTLAPLVWDPNLGFVWLLREKFSTLPGLVVLSGILMAVVGIFLCGMAGALRERSTGDSPSRYSFKIGIPLACLAGLLSAVFNFALLAGEPLADAALKVGANDLLKMNAIYPFSNGGAWVTNLMFCIVLITRNRSGKQFIRLPGQGGNRLGFYYLMGILSGAMWYFQFFFYGMGHAFMGKQYGFTSWILHMAILILFSNLYGKLFREWEGADPKPRRILNLGMLSIVIASLIIAYGNYLGEVK